MLERTKITAPPFLVLGVPALILALAACGAPQGGGASAPPEAAGAVSDDASGETAASAMGGRDIQTLDLCVAIPVAEVAEVLGLDPGHGTAEATLGQWASDCTYSFERDAFYDYAMIFAYPPQIWAPDLDSEAEPVPGLGDAAFLSSTGSFAKMHVLLAGDVYLDTRADTPEQARRLAELAVARLTGR